MHVRAVMIQSEVHRGTTRDLADPDIPVVSAGQGAVRDTARIGRPGGIGLDAPRGGDLSRPRQLRERAAAVFVDQAAKQEAEGAGNEHAGKTRNETPAPPSRSGGRRLVAF